MEPIRILIVEDDTAWVAALTSYLNKEADMQVCASAATSAEAISLYADSEFDVVLMDIHLQGSELDGIHTAVELSELKPGKIIMLTSASDEELMRDSFTAGAVNYIDKANFKELPHAIRSAYHRPAAMEVLLKEYARLKREEQLKQLTQAEREVFELIEDGYTQSQIGAKLYKAESTLKNQVNKMLRKLGVKSSKEAVKKVKRKGL
ncbi:MULTISPECIES: response regulator transcription factor [unclassified Paenibacillus]|uniref:response regulator transcription factor n=1 Tax=unclassified Paenibacillus TaxID=185978 RepID=UPI002F426AF5